MPLTEVEIRGARLKRIMGIAEDCLTVDCEGGGKLLLMNLPEECIDREVRAQAIKPAFEAAERNADHLLKISTQRHGRTAAKPSLPFYLQSQLKLRLIGRFTHRGCHKGVRRITYILHKTPSNPLPAPPKTCMKVYQGLK